MDAVFTFLIQNGESSCINVLFIFEMEIKKTRERLKATKRWTKEDIDVFLDLLRHDKNDIEKPSARIFYNKMECFLMGYGWKEMRDKTRNLKTTYKKALDWKNTALAGQQEDTAGPEIKENILKICPYFDALDDIFTPDNNETELIRTLEAFKTECDAIRDTDNQNELLDDYGPEGNQSEAADSCISASTTSSRLKRKLIKTPKSSSSANLRFEAYKNKIARLEKTVAFQEAGLLLKKQQFMEEIRLRKQQLELERFQAEKQCRFQDELIRLEEFAIKEKVRLKELELANKLQIAELKLKFKYCPARID